MTDIRTVDSSGLPAEILHVGVVVAGWNPTITERLLDGAVARLEAEGVGTITVLRVPGSLELAVGARALLEAGCDAVVALGVVVRGDTDHYATVVRESARGLTLLAHEWGVPVANGVLAVHDIEQAVDRAQPGRSNKGDEAAAAAVATALAITAAGALTATADADGRV